MDALLKLLRVTTVGGTCVDLSGFASQTSELDKHLESLAAVRAEAERRLVEEHEPERRRELEQKRTELWALHKYFTEDWSGQKVPGDTRATISAQVAALFQNVVYDPVLAATFGAPSSLKFADITSVQIFRR